MSLPPDLVDTVNTPTGEPEVSLGALVVTSDGSLLAAAAGLRMCPVEIHGERVNRRIDLSQPSILIGRVDDNDVVISSASVSRHHCRLEEIETGYEVVDLDSTNGTLVNQARVERCPLRHEDLLIIGDTAFRYLATAELDDALASVAAQIAATDGLTQIPNRAALAAALSVAAEFTPQRHVVVLAIEHAERLEATYGSLSTDRVVALVAAQLGKRLRKSDLLACLGRFHFAVLLDVGDELSAQRKAAALRRHVSLSTFRSHETRIPVSLVAAVVSQSEDAGADVMASIDRLAAQLLRPAVPADQT